MKLTVLTRENKIAKELRKEGLVPGIVYGKNLETPIAIACPKNDLIKKYKEAGYSTPITLEGEKINQLVLIQDIQLDPVTDVLIHIDFLAINANEKVKTEISIILTGECPLEKAGEGKAQLIKDFIEVEALPQDLPHNITIDISTLETMNDVIFIKDLKLSNKVEILDDIEQPLVNVISMKEEIIEEEVATPTAEAEGDSATTKDTSTTEETKEDK